MDSTTITTFVIGIALVSIGVIIGIKKYPRKKQNTQEQDNIFINMTQNEITLIKDVLVVIESDSDTDKRIAKYKLTGAFLYHQSLNQKQLDYIADLESKLIKSLNIGNSNLRKI